MRGYILDYRKTNDIIKRARNIIETIPTKSFNYPSIFKYTLQTEAEEKGKRYVVEQTPRNIFYISKLLKFYPQAKILHMIRDPRAVLFSQKNRWRRRGLGSNTPLYNTIRVFVNYHSYTVTNLWKKSDEIGQFYLIIHNIKESFLKIR